MKTSAIAAPAFLAVALAVSLPLAGNARTPDTWRQSKKKPDVALRASPKLGFAPATVQFHAILQGGDDDYEPYYCPSIEWDWDDDTVSQSTPDCEPYEPGQSRIARRYSASHVFRLDGHYEVKFRLKRKGSVLVLATVTVQVRPG